MTLLLVALLLHESWSSAVRVPNQLISIRDDPTSGSPKIDVVVSGVVQADHAITLSLSAISVVATDHSSYAYDRSIVLGDNVSFPDPELLFVRDAAGRSQLAMGPRSPMLQHFSPIMIMRSSSHPISLVLNSTDEFFHDHCVPESISSIEYRNAIKGIRVAASIVFGDNQLVIPSSPHGSIMLKYISDHVLLAVPRGSYMSIISSIMALGLIRVPGSNFYFSNCSSILPDAISLQVRFQPSNTTLASLILNAEDILRRIPQSDVCRLLITETNRASLDINPFLIPGINFRIHNNNVIQFCDTSVV